MRKRERRLDLLNVNRKKTRGEVKKKESEEDCEERGGGGGEQSQKRKMRHVK